MKLVKPWLKVTHKNFFFIYVITMIFHLWAAVVGFFSPATFLSGGLHFINFIHPALWAAVNLIVGVGMFAGLHLETFKVSRMFLSLGMFWCLLRFLLILFAWVGGYAVGIGPAMYFLAAGLHRSQTLEPPENPASI